MGGILSSCCGGASSGGDGGYRSYRDDPQQAERDREARARAAAQAEARQQKFESSAVGRAALKAVTAAKKQDARPNAGPSAQDWLS
jgi:hypothetical protein